MFFPTRKTFQGKHLAKFNMAEDEESMTNFTVQLTLPISTQWAKTVPPPPPPPPPLQQLYCLVQSW